MTSATLLRKQKRKNTLLLWTLAALVVLFSFVCLLAGVSNMSIQECVDALFGNGTPAALRIIWNIRIPRVIAAIVAGAGLSMAGLVMQTTLNNSMASASTLGVSNAAVFGANLSIIGFAGGFLSTGNNPDNYLAGANPFAAGVLAFVFAVGSVLLNLALCRFRGFRSNVVVLCGIAIGSVWTAATTILQYYATDVGLSAAVVWSFGDLSRADYGTNLLMLAVVVAGGIFFGCNAWKFNAMLSGEAAAKTMGVNVERFRFWALLLSALITAVCVSVLGIVSFVGIICPHVVKRLLGQDHRVSILASCLSGSLLLLLADTAARLVGSGSALPVGAVTALLGAPFFLAVIFLGKENRNADC